MNQVVRWMERLATGDFWSVVRGVEALGPSSRADPAVAAFCAMLDERVRTRDAFDDYNRGLEHAVREELEEERDRALLAEARATAASEAKSRFLANVSHELRTPLNVILGYTEMLLEEDMDRGFRKDLSCIHDASRHLLSLIDGVLDLSRIEAGHTAIQLEEVDLAYVVEEIAAAMKPIAQSNGNEIAVDVAPLGVVVTDERMMRQVVLNIMSNACKFTLNGRVSLTAGRNVEQVWLAVTDTGVGMAPDAIELAFEEFTQVTALPGKPSPGTGLGLPISRTLCRMLGGELTADSELGVGSTFRVELPIVSQPTPAPTRVNGNTPAEFV